MKFTLTDSEYRQGLASFLDENHIEWTRRKANEVWVEDGRVMYN